VDGVQHDFWRVSEERLRRALRLPWGQSVPLVRTLCIRSQTTYGGWHVQRSRAIRFRSRARP
jgi:hypothetical protein